MNDDGDDDDEGIWCKNGYSPRKNKVSSLPDTAESVVGGVG